MRVKIWYYNNDKKFLCSNCKKEFRKVLQVRRHVLGKLAKTVHCHKEKKPPGTWKKIIDVIDPHQFINCGGKQKSNNRKGKLTPTIIKNLEPYLVDEENEMGVNQEGEKELTEKENGKLNEEENLNGDELMENAANNNLNEENHLMEQNNDLENKNMENDQNLNDLMENGEESYNGIIAEEEGEKELTEKENGKLNGDEVLNGDELMDNEANNNLNEVDHLMENAQNEEFDLTMNNTMEPFIILDGGFENGQKVAELNNGKGENLNEKNVELTESMENEDEGKAGKNIGPENMEGKSDGTKEKNGQNLANEKLKRKKEMIKHAGKVVEQIKRRKRQQEAVKIWKETFLHGKKRELGTIRARKTATKNVQNEAGTSGTSGGGKMCGAGRSRHLRTMGFDRRRLDWEKEMDKKSDGGGSSKNGMRKRGIHSNGMRESVIPLQGGDTYQIHNNVPVQPPPSYQEAVNYPAPPYSNYQPNNFPNAPLPNQMAGQQNIYPPHSGGQVHTIYAQPSANQPISTTHIHHTHTTVVPPSRRNPCSFCSGSIESETDVCCLLCLILFAIFTFPFGLMLLFCIPCTVRRRCNTCRRLYD